MTAHPAVDAEQPAALRPVRRGNALEDTVARLLETVRVGLVAPGASLPSERDLAAGFGVGRDTVRDAIRELAAAGYLVARRGRYGGTFVADPLPVPAVSVDASGLDDVLGLRRVLEVGAVRAAAAQALTPDQRDRLRAAEQATRDASPADYRRRDSLLHLEIAGLAGIPSLLPLVTESRARLNVLLGAFPLLPGNIRHSDDQHTAIVEAVLAGDQDGAVRAAEEHLAGSEALLRGFLTPSRRPASGS